MRDERLLLAAGCLVLSSDSEELFDTVSKSLARAVVNVEVERVVQVAEHAENEYEITVDSQHVQTHHEENEGIRQIADQVGKGESEQRARGLEEFETSVHVLWRQFVVDNATLLASC